MRLRPYHRLDEIELRAAAGADPARATRLEGEAILKLLDPADHVWLLERTGELLTSEELSRRIERLPHQGIARLTVVIAGTYGAYGRAARAGRHMLVPLAAHVPPRVGARAGSGATVPRGEDRPR